MLRLIATALMLGMTGGQALAGNYCGGYSYGNYGYSSYYYPKVVEKIVYVSQYYPYFVPTPYTTYVPPAIVPLTPLGQLTPVAAGVAPAPIAVAPIIPVAVQARAVVPAVAVAPVVSGGVDTVLLKIMAKLESIEREQADIRAKLSPPTEPPEEGKTKERIPPPAEKKLTGLGVFNKRCASCHSAEMAKVPVKAGAAKLKGGGFVMFKPLDPKAAKDAQLETVVFTAGQIADIYDRILLPVNDKDHMPPNEQLEPAEGNLILEWLGAVRKAAKKAG
jgi:hypothetical protein